MNRREFFSGFVAAAIAIKAPLQEVFTPPTVEDSWRLLRIQWQPLKRLEPGVYFTGETGCEFEFHPVPSFVSRDDVLNQIRQYVPLADTAIIDLGGFPDVRSVSLRAVELAEAHKGMAVLTATIPPPPKFDALEYRHDASRTDLV